MSDTAPIPEFAPMSRMVKLLPEAERLELGRVFRSQRAWFRGFFPRGRFVMWEDGRCCCVPRSKSLRNAHLAYFGPEKVRLMFGSRQWFLKAIPETLVVSKTGGCGEGDDEGFWIVRAVPALAECLPWFQKRKPNQVGGKTNQASPEGPYGVGIDPKMPG